MTLHWFNEEALATATRHTQKAPAGFAYGYIPDIIRPDRYEELIADFPDPSGFKLVDKLSGGGRKRFFVGPSYFSGRDHGCLCMFRRFPAWHQLFEEAGSSEVTAMLSKAMGTNFNSVCDFGLAYGNEGCLQEPHIDGSMRPDDPNKVRSTVATIVYLNSKPDPIGGTAVYLPDRSTVVMQAPHLHNGMFFFQQHPQAWHGFPLMPADTERRVLSLSWSQEKQPIKRRGFWHCLFCRNFWKSMYEAVGT